jgi:hypothetical protein
MMKVPNLLLITGTGNKSGKTTLACRIIAQSVNKGVAAIKITPHFHETTDGLILLREEKGYSVYEETNQDTRKDTSRMLRAGARKVFFAKVTDNDLLSAFRAIMDYLPDNTPMVCESPGLRHFVEPGLLMIMKSDNAYNNKDINSFLKLPHVLLHLEDFDQMEEIPVKFEGGKWTGK